LAAGLTACLALAAIGPPARAGIILNAEPNNTFGTAQVIPSADFTLDFVSTIGSGAGGGFVNTSTTMPHVTIERPGTGETTANLDYFRFTTTVSGRLILDIDSTPVPTNFDTVLHLFTGSGILLATNDDNGGDPGDGPGLIGGLLNSRIETGVLPAGTYVAAVAQSPSVGSNGGGVTDPIPAGGSYTLNISIPAAPLLPIPEPTSLSLLSVGVVSLTGFALWRRRPSG
jgi:hypothetical protein